MIRKKIKLSLAAILSTLIMTVGAPLLSMFFLVGYALPAQASPFAMNLEVPIPTLNGGDAHIKFTGDTGPIADYVKAIYTYAVAAVGIVAAVVMMIGGLMWITAGGNASSISEAKSMITASLTGLVLVLTSYLILDQVNPSLVNLSNNISQISGITNQTVAPTCTWSHAAWAEGDTDLILPAPNGKISQGLEKCGPNYQVDDGNGGYEDRSSHCCCTAAAQNPIAGSAQLTCGSNQCSQVDTYIQSAAATYGVDANIIKAIIVGGEGCSANKSPAGACGYGQEMPQIRKWCGAEGTDAETCQQFQEDPQFSIDCTASLISQGQGSQCKASVNFIARCYNTGNIALCGNPGEDTYCTRVQSFYDSCQQK
jgi:hypothetical protein